MQHAPDIVAKRSLEYVDGTFDVGAHISSRRFVGVRDADQRRQMEDDIGTLAARLTLSGSVMSPATISIS